MARKRAEAAPSGHFKVSRDPAFAEKVADIVGLYLDPPGSAVVLDRRGNADPSPGPHPADAADDVRRHRAAYCRLRPEGTTNLFASLNVGTGEVFGLCSSARDGADFLGFLKKAVKPHAGKDVHVVLDNLSTHNTPDGLKRNPKVTFHFTPTGLIMAESSRNMVRQHHSPIHPPTALSAPSDQSADYQNRDYINHWNDNAKPFAWTATADEILTKVRVVQTSIVKLVDNNAK